ncbi:hypothetical protein AtNW77_Chr2g0258551 [Arabidopsis thaliana]
MVIRSMEGHKIFLISLILFIYKHILLIISHSPIVQCRTTQEAEQINKYTYKCNRQKVSLKGK